MKLLLGVVFFGSGALFMHMMAVSNRRGLVINGVIELGVEGARTFYWCLAGLAAGFVLLIVAFFLPQIWIDRQIILDDDGMTLPGWGFSRSHYRVPWSEIESISRWSHGKITYLKIRHAGRTFGINSAWLPCAGDITTIEQFIRRYMGPLQ
jgi:hypothetical protein